MRRHIEYALIVVALLALVVWGISVFIQPVLPSNINSSLVLFFAALLGVTGLLARFKGIVELVQWIRERPRQSPKYQSNSQPTETSSTRIESLSQSIKARAKFLDAIDNNSKPDELQRAANDLVRFIEKILHGSYFAQRIAVLTQEPAQAGNFSYIKNEGGVYQNQTEHANKYRQQLREARTEIYALIDELLRLQ